MATRTITGTIQDGEGQPVAGESVQFRLLTPLAANGDGLVARQAQTDETDVDGAFSIDLAVPDAGSWQWLAVMPDRQSFAFALDAGAATTLTDLING